MEGVGRRKAEVIELLWQEAGGGGGGGRKKEG